MQQSPTSNNSRRLWKFHGGVHLPDEKALSNGNPVRVARLPRQLAIPLQQHIGAAAKALVKPGDPVLKGQKIGEAQGYVSAAVHASSSGTVIAVEKRPVPHPSGLQAPCIVIETDGKDTWAELPPPSPTTATWIPPRCESVSAGQGSSAWGAQPSPQVSSSTRARSRTSAL